MFVGHYAAALALRPLKASPSLPVTFVAVQALDIGFFGLALADIERYSIETGATVMNNLALDYLPYTHSLVGAAALSVLFGLALYPFLRAQPRIMAAAIAAFCVFSHWLLDLPVHRPDLGIIGDSDHKLGFGLWNHPEIAMPLEIGLLLIGLFIWTAATRAKNAAGRYMPWIALAFLLALQAFNWFGPQPTPETNLDEVSMQGLLAYGLIAVFAIFMERTRERKA